MTMEQILQWQPHARLYAVFRPKQMQGVWVAS